MAIGDVFYKRRKLEIDTDKDFFTKNGKIVTEQSMRDFVKQRINEYKIRDSGIFNIKMLGATGNGISNDTNFIKTAINEAISNPISTGIVYLPPGHYKTTGNILINECDGLKIRGAGVSNTVIIIDHSTNDLFKINNKVSNFELSNITIISNPEINRNGGWVLRVISSSQDSSTCLINSIIKNINIHEQKNGLWLSKYDNIKIMNINIDRCVNNGIGIGIGQPTNSDSIQGDFLTATGINVCGLNNSENNEKSLISALKIDSVKNTFISECRLKNCKGYIIDAIGSELPGYYSDNTIINNSYISDSDSYGIVVRNQSEFHLNNTFIYSCASGLINK